MMQNREDNVESSQYVVGTSEEFKGLLGRVISIEYQNQDCLKIRWYGFGGALIDFDAYMDSGGRYKQREPYKSPAYYVSRDEFVPISFASFEAKYEWEQEHDTADIDSPEFFAELERDRKEIIYMSKEMIEFGKIIPDDGFIIK